MNAKNKKVVADSIKRAAAIMGLSPAIVRAAKAAGADGFRGHRVNIEDLRSWIRKNPQVAVKAAATEKRTSEVAKKKLALEVQKLQVAIELAQHRLTEERDQYVSASVVKSEWTRFMGIVMQEAQALLEPSIFEVFQRRIRAQIKS